MMRIILALSMLLASLLPAQEPAIDVTCAQVTLYYQAPGFNPRAFSAAVVLDSASLPLAYSGTDGKGYHTWTARINPGRDLRARGVLRHNVLDFVMMSREVKVRCLRPWGR